MAECVLLLSADRVLLFDVNQHVLGKGLGSEEGHDAIAEWMVLGKEEDDDESWDAEARALFDEVFPSALMPDLRTVADRKRTQSPYPFASFRLPLRGGPTTQRFTDNWYPDAESRNALLEEMREGAEGAMVFLKSLQRVKFQRYDSSGLRTLGEVSVTPWDEGFADFLAAVNARTGMACYPPKPGACEERLVRTHFGDRKGEFRFLVRQVVDYAHPGVAEVRENLDQSEKTVPWVAVALPEEPGDAWPWHVTLPLMTDVPGGALLHGAFFLDSERRAPLYQKQKASYSERGYTDWNESLVRDLLVPLVREVITAYGSSEPGSAEESCRRVGWLPPFRRKISNNPPATLAEFYQSEFHESEWSLRLGDFFGLPFTFAGARSGSLQAVDPELERFREALRNYVKARQDERTFLPRPLADRIAARFPNASGWLGRSGLPFEVTVALLRALPERPSEEDLNLLVNRLGSVRRDEAPKLEGCVLFLDAEGKGIAYSTRWRYLAAEPEPDTALAELLGLGFTFDRFCRVRPTAGAGVAATAQRLGLDLLAPDDRAARLLLERIAPEENHHNRLKPAQLIQLKRTQALLESLNANELQHLKLAWMIATQGRPYSDLFQSRIVCHYSGQSQREEQRFWKALLQHLFVQVHPEVSEMIVRLQEKFPIRPDVFDSRDAQVVRTVAGEVLSWLAEVWNCRGDERLQTRVATEIAECLNRVTGEEQECGADALVGIAWPRFRTMNRFVGKEAAMLASLPIHQLADGRRVPLALPEQSGHYAHQVIGSRKHYRLKRDEDVAIPPGIEQTFELLAPSAPVRAFYREVFGFEEHTPQEVVLDVLEQIGRVPQHFDRQLEYLAQNLPLFRTRLKREGSERKLAQLNATLASARLVPTLTGELRPAAECANVSGMLRALQQFYDADEAGRLAAALVEPKIPAAPKGYRQEWLRMLSPGWEICREEDVPIRAMKSLSPELEFPIRMELVHRFYGVLPRESALAEKLKSMLVPCLGGEHPLDRAKLLPARNFGLSQALVTRLFPLAVDVPQLARRAKIEETAVREVLEAFGLREVDSEWAGKEIRERFEEVWPKLETDDRLMIFESRENAPKGVAGLRWKLTIQHVLAGLSSLDGEEDSAADLHGRLAQLLLDSAQSPAELPVPPAPRVTVRTVAGVYRPAAACAVSRDLGRSGKTHLDDASQAHVVDLADAWSGQLVKWLGLSFLEDTVMPEVLAEPVPCSLSADQETVLLPWIDLLKRFAAPADQARHALQELLGRELASGEGVVDVCGVQSVSVRYETPAGSVSGASDWSGPEVTPWRKGRALLVRLDAIPVSGGSREARALERFDQTMSTRATMLLLRDGERGQLAAVADLLRSFLERPVNVLTRLHARGERSLVDRFDRREACAEFKKLYEERERTKSDTEEWKRLTGELTKIAGRCMVELTRRETAERGYKVESLFAELLQNAEDAYRQRACLEMGPPQYSRITYRLVTDEITGAQCLEIEHFGRPFNYWRHGEHRQENFQYDIDRLCSDSGSFKADGDAGVQVVGRFGLGFKSVYLVTDRPRIHSHIWDFELESACMPVPIAKPPGLDREATRIVLPLIESQRMGKLPAEKLFTGFMPFLQEIHEIQLEDADGKRCLLREAEELGNREVRASRVSVVRDGDGGRSITARLVVLGAPDSQARIALTLDEEGLPVPCNTVFQDDLYATFPLEDRHKCGVALSHTFMLQSGRAHLATECQAGNRDRFAELGNLLAKSGAALRDLAGERALSFFGRFWKIWRFRNADTTLQNFLPPLADGLVRLARTSDTVPRWSGKCMACGDTPAVYVEPTLPAEFIRDVAGLDSPIRLENGTRLTLDALADRDIAFGLREACLAAGLGTMMAHELSWDELLPFFQGADSLFCRRPALLDGLARSLSRLDAEEAVQVRSRMNRFLSNSTVPDEKGDGARTKEMFDPKNLSQSKCGVFPGAVPE